MAVAIFGRKRLLSRLFHPSRACGSQFQVWFGSTACWPSSARLHLSRPTDRAYSAGSTLSSRCGQPALMYPLPD